MESFQPFKIDVRMVSVAAHATASLHDVDGYSVDVLNPEHFEPPSL